MTDSRKQNQFIVMACIVCGFILPLVLPSYWQHVFTLIFVKIILCLSLRQMMLSGLLNLSIVAFMGIGAYFSVVMTTTLQQSFWLILPLAGLLGFLIGGVLSYPLFRLKGAYFFIGTVCFAVAVTIFFSNFFVQIFGGTPGFTPIVIPHIKMLGLDISLHTNIAHYYLTFGVMLISCFVMWRLEFSRIGIYWKAISQADVLLQAVGVNLFAYKRLNFCISCFFACICGGIYAHVIGIITPDDFGLEFLFVLVALLVVGGIHSYCGAIIGVVSLSVIAEWMRDFGQYETLSYGVVLVLAMLFMPKGLMGVIEKLGLSFKEGS